LNLLFFSPIFFRCALPIKCFVFLFFFPFFLFFSTLFLSLCHLERTPRCFVLFLPYNFVTLFSVAYFFFLVFFCLCLCFFFASLGVLAYFVLLPCFFFFLVLFSLLVLFVVHLRYSLLIAPDQARFLFF